MEARSPSLVGTTMTNQIRHPELVSGSISPLHTSVCAARWMLKQVQHDVGGNASLRPLRVCVNSLICHSRESGERSDRQVNPWAELSEKRFAQRHEGIKRLLPVFVSSCELKTYRARKYKTMGSRFRGNDNLGVLGCVNGYARRPSAGWGLSRLSAKWFAQRHEGTKRLLPVFVSSCEPKTYRVRKYKTMGSRFRGNDNVGVLGCVNGYARRPELVCASTPAALWSISPLVPLVCAARWMLKQVQHDVGRSIPPRPLRFCVIPLMCHSRESGNPWAELSSKWFAQRHEGTKKLLRVFVSSCELKSFSARQYRTMGSRFRGNDNFGVLGCVNEYSRRPSAGWGLYRLSAKWFAQRHEGTKKLLRVFVSSCEPKSCRVRKCKTMGSRFRGNDNGGAFGCVSRYPRRPELVCASTPAALGSISPLYPSVGLAQWMLKQVQHDAGGNASLRPLRLCVNPLMCHSRFRGSDNFGVLGA